MKITILGAGDMGAALTVPLAERGHTAALWCTDHDDEIHRALTAGKPHPGLQSDLPGPVRIFGPGQIEEAMAKADLVILGVSTPGVFPVLRQAKPHLRATMPLLTVAKGFLSRNGTAEPVLSAIQGELQDLGPGARPPLLGLAGPSIAGEIVRHRPTAAAIAGDDHGQANTLCEKLETDSFWLDSIHDLRGFEICLAYKNIYSIALAWAEGLSESPGWESARNLSAILLLQAVEELRRLIKHRHGNPDTAGGWSGLGDLAATAGGGRNGRFGHLLATGKSPDQAAATLEREGVATIEGRSAAPHGVDYAARTLGSDWGAHLPLLHAIRQVLEGEKTVREIVRQIHRFRAGYSTSGIDPNKGAPQ